MFKNLNTIVSAITNVIVTTASTIDIAVSSVNDLALAGKQHSVIVRNTAEFECKRNQIDLDNKIAEFEALLLAPKTKPKSKK